MAGQFELGSKHIQYKSQIQSVLAEISLNDTKEALKQLNKKSYGFIPSKNAAYDDYLGLAVIIEEISKKKPAVASLMVDQITAQEIINRYGTESGKALLNSGNIFAVLCAEPGVSVLSAMNTKAVKSSNNWTLTGKKLISKEQLNADSYLVFANDEENIPRVFIVPSSKISLTSTSKEIAGSNLTVNHAEFNLQLTDKDLVASINDNFEKVQSISRTMIASVALGIAHSAIVTGVNIVKEVKGPENQAISNTQSAQFTLTDMFIELEAGRMLTYLSADMIDKDKSNIKYATMAKVQATEAAGNVSLQSLQILGNLGYIANNDFADMMQTAISSQVKGGTNRVQKNQIYQFMLAKK